MKFIVALLTFLLFPLLEAAETPSPEEIFTRLYEKRTHWPGSTLQNTVEYRDFLSKFLIDHQIKSVVDFGCGNWSFSKAIDWSGIDYYGYDVVKKFIEENNQFASDTVHFIHADALETKLPKADLLICKDVLQHLTEAQVLRFLELVDNFRYVLIITDPYYESIPTNSQISMGEYRPLDITLPPFYANATLIFDYTVNKHIKHVLLIDNSFVAKPKSNKTVFLAILARNKAHLLDMYLKCIENLDYDKKSITLYIHTNNNSDKTEEVLRDWIKKNGDLYSKVIFETDMFDLDKSNPHQWTRERLNVLASIRNLSLKKALEYGVDYYFVVDCDNFIRPHTLRYLVDKDKPIIAPMLKCVPKPNDINSNFFFATDNNGYYKKDPEYYRVVARTKVGTFKVPLVHCTYLIKKEYLGQLDYSSPTGEWEFIVFARNARKHGIDQYICNEKFFGTNFGFNENITVEEEAERVKKMKLSDFGVS